MFLIECGAIITNKTYQSFDKKKLQKMCKYIYCIDYSNKLNEIMNEFLNSYIFTHLMCNIVYAKDKLSEDDILKLLYYYILEKNRNWLRRLPLMNVLTGYKIRPIKPVNGIFDTSISIPSEILDTLQKKHNNMIRCIFNNDLLLQLIMSFL
jgi:hypothetical protein